MPAHRFEHQLPSPHEAELLDILIEECSEVIKRASKLKRFGRDEIQSGYNDTNGERLAYEIGDVQAMVSKVIECGLVTAADITFGMNLKLKKLPDWMLTKAPKHKSIPTKYCIVCGLEQHETPSGISCAKGHGGAESVSEAEANDLRLRLRNP